MKTLSGLGKYFYLALVHSYEESKFKTQKELAKSAEIGISSLNEAFKKKGASQITQEKIAKVFGYNDLLTFLNLGMSIDKGEDIFIQQPSWQPVISECATDVDNKIIDYKDKKNASHHLIVDKFQQPELAKEINDILIKIEKKSKIKLKRIKKYLLDELEELTEDDDKSTQSDQKKKSG